MFPPGPWSVNGTTEWCQGIYGPLLVPRPDVLPQVRHGGEGGSSSSLGTRPADR